MSHVKTAISLDQELFDQIESVAGELQVSRSHLVALALQEFLQRHQNRQLLEQINAAYDDAPDSSERALQQTMTRRHRKRVEGTW